jgi:hypothetical protein
LEYYLSKPWQTKGHNPQVNEYLLKYERKWGGGDIYLCVKITLLKQWVRMPFTDLNSSGLYAYSMPGPVFASNDQHMSFLGSVI